MDVVPLDEIRSSYACGVCGAAPCVFLISEIDEILSDPRVHNAQQVRRSTATLPYEALLRSHTTSLPRSHTTPLLLSHT